MLNPTTPYVEIDETSKRPRILIHADFRYKEQCKLLPGSKYDDASGCWWMPLTWAACKQLRGVFGENLTIGPQLLDWSWTEYKERVEPCMMLRSMTDAPGDERLRTFQRAGLHFLDYARHAALCDDMGTGKTVQLVSLLQTLDDRGWSPYPALVVAPNSVKPVWRREAQKWTDANVRVLAGGAATRRKILAEEADIYIINYELARTMSRLAGYGNIKLTDAEKKPKDLNAIPWRTVIADEAHRLKDPKSKQTRALWWLAHQDSVVWRYALTGTPLANAPDDLWSILHMIEPDEWPSRTEYIDRYCLYAWNPFGTMAVCGVRPETSDEFFSIVDPRMRRMPKDLVLPHLPPKVRSIRYCEMGAKQAKAYKQMEAEMFAQLGDGDDDATVATLPIVQRTRLMQFSSSFARLEWSGTYLADGVTPKMDVKLEFPSSKIDDLLLWMDELPIDEPFIVAAESRQLIDMAGKRLEEAGVTCRYIVGGMSDAERERATDEFQAGHARVMLLTIKAGGEGITLTRANQIAFLQRSWSMIGNRQTEDRVHRIGSEIHTSITITDFIAPDSVEVEQIERLHEKLERLEEIVRDRKTLEAAAAAGDATAIAKLHQYAAEEAAIMAQDDFAPIGRTS